LSDKNPTQVLMVAYSYYESDPRVIREAEAAVSGGFDVDFLALRKPGKDAEETIRGVHVFRINQPKFRGGTHVKYVFAYLEFFFRCMFWITARYFNRRYRIIHVNNMPDFLVFSTIVPRLFGCKVILDIHDPMPNTFASKFKGREGGFFYWLLLIQERISAAYSSRIVTVHDPVKDGILVKHGLAPDSINVVANFADGDLFKLRTSYSIEPLRMVFHGTILERSGLKILVIALSKMRHKERVLIKIIGEGDFSATLKQMIESLGLQKMVDFDNRSYPAHSIAERISDCNVGLVPLEISSVTNYALPLKLFEYISLGLPVVAVRSAAISYYFNEQDCMFFDWDNPQTLADVLDRIAENPEILLRYRQRSIEVRDKFSWNSEKAKYITLLKDLVGSPKAMGVSNN
jgi:glycosyltransferase involved in cell wall biosynthesis